MGQIIPFRRSQPVPAFPEQPEVVATVLLALEDAPLFPPRMAADRGFGGRPSVRLAVAGRDFRLTPQDARLTADALEAEHAFVGCLQVAADLRRAATLADQMRRVG